LPLQCALCDAPVEQQGQLCAACFSRTSFITAPCCTRCGVPFAAADQGGALRLCPACRDAPPVYGEARAALRYDRQARQLILPFKHADRTELARVLAPHMARAGADLLRRAELLVPVPLHRGRLFHRRYNQAALLAAALSRRNGRPVVVDALLRVRPTVPLGDKSAEERATGGDADRQALAVDRRRDDLGCDRQCLRGGAAGSRSRGRGRAGGGAGA
jgi:predicted amidophosphoribosyltransferase